MSEINNNNDNSLEKQETKKKPDRVREALEWCEVIVSAVVAVVFLFSFVVRTSQVDGKSMLPTLVHGDVLLISRTLTNFEYGDIVISTKPNYHDQPYVKRVIATEGQTVNIDFIRGIVYVDGIALDEPYTFEPTYDDYDVEFPVTVPEGCVFLMGDNRNNSLDSRSSEVGMVDERYILGKAYWRVVPYENFGGLYA